VPHVGDAPETSDTLVVPLIVGVVCVHLTILCVDDDCYCIYSIGYRTIAYYRTATFRITNSILRETRRNYETNRFAAQLSNPRERDVVSIDVMRNGSNAAAITNWLDGH
jgi:hypothetical protein